MKTTDLSVCALLIGDHGDGRLLLYQVFRDSGWRLLEAQDRNRALDCLDRNSVQVVITNSEGDRWPWKKILDHLLRRAKPPQLIVTSHTADEQLWAEVLNRGGYDVLARPFRREEIERVVASARRHFDLPLRTHANSAGQDIVLKG
jgi:DNA-binding NtrC family response regulator